jgi:hypothetical protein
LARGKTRVKTCPAAKEGGVRCLAIFGKCRNIQLEPLQRAGNHAVLVTVAVSLLPLGLKLLL